MAQKDTLESFINKANTIHKNIYDYSLVNYINSYEKIKIICKYHGIFIVTPNAHLTGRKCPGCAKNVLKSTKDFIKTAQIKHGDKYLYTKTLYTGRHKNSTFTCKIHGDFEQTPKSHLNGNGCPKCARNSHSKISLQIFAF